MAVAFLFLVSSSLYSFIPLLSLSPSAFKTCFLFLYWSVWRYRLSLIPAGYIIDYQHEDDYGLNLKGKKVIFPRYVFGLVSSTICPVLQRFDDTSNLHFQQCGICANLIRKLNSFYMISSFGFSRLGQTVQALPASFLSDMQEWVSVEISSNKMLKSPGQYLWHLCEWLHDGIFSHCHFRLIFILWHLYGFSVEKRIKMLFI